MPSKSLPPNAPNIAEPARRSANRASVQAASASASKVLLKASGQRCSASRRISQYNAASSARNRRISVAISLIPITTRHSRHQHTWAGKDGPWPLRLQRVQAVSTRSGGFLREDDQTEKLGSKVG